MPKKAKTGPKTCSLGNVFRINLTHFLVTNLPYSINRVNTFLFFCGKCVDNLELQADRQK